MSDRMTREEAREIILNTAFIGRSQEEIDTAIEMAAKALEQEPIKALGEELRKVREGIKDGIVLYGYDKAVAICNKHLEGEEV